MVKILVIEDEAAIRDEVMDWLQFEGYEVMGAIHGRHGLELIHHDLPDLIVCDIAMPEMDGTQVLIEVRANPKLSQIPFVFLTAMVDRESIRRGMNLGADDYLTKPFTRAELLHTIRTRLEKKAANDLLVRKRLDILSHALGEERERRLLKSRMVAMFSHDFRNPLAVILSSASLLRDYEVRLDAPTKRRKLDLIVGSVQHLLQMLDDMMLAAEIEGGYLGFQPKKVDIAALLNIILDEFSLIDSSQHKLILETSVERQFDTDVRLMRHIVANLISNALKYSPAESKILLTLHESNSMLELTVQDQGIGIPPDELEHIFEPFHRAVNARDISGTGLGLTLVKQAVEVHGGSITIESTLGKGTHVSVLLPAH